MLWNRFSSPPVQYDLIDIRMEEPLEPERSSNMHSTDNANIAPKVRKLFPETWLWNNYSNDSTRFVLKARNIY